MSWEPLHRSQGWRLLALTVFSFFFMLGGRSLNEPDEGRYAEIAREMLETGDWRVPHLWYVPHLDKPPLTYWAVAASLSFFGRNEWAVRLPVALAGLSGVWAAYLLGRGLGGRRAGLWSALILQSSLLYFVMSRMLTSDIFLSQFIAWAIYFGWRSWRALDGSARQHAAGNRARRSCLAWQLAAWIAIALGFLTKGPIALLIPLVAGTALAVYRRSESARWRLLRPGLWAGLLLFSLLAGPWFIWVFLHVPEAFNYMVASQFFGHALGTTIKNRQGSPFYFLVILGVGFLPWTPLLGWLWRPIHWRSLNPIQKDGWILLTAWVAFTFLTFSLTRAKLPAYILPLFPALSVLVALRWFSDQLEAQPSLPVPLVGQASLPVPLVGQASLPVPLVGQASLPVPLVGQASLPAPADSQKPPFANQVGSSESGSSLRLNGNPGRTLSSLPRWIWGCVMLSPFILMATVSLSIRFEFKVTEASWLWPHLGIAMGGLGVLLIWARHWDPMRCAYWAVMLGLINLLALATLAPTVETFLKSNQTLKPLAVALKGEHHPGDIVVCWGSLPQGLPFYLYPIVNAAHPPLLGGVSFKQVPFEFPGNRQRFGNRVVPDEAALGRLLAGEAKVWVAGFQGAFAGAQQQVPQVTLRLITRVGRWELFTNR